MLDQVLDVFRVVPDYNLGIAKANQTLFYHYDPILEKIQPVLEQENPMILSSSMEIPQPPFATAYGLLYGHQVIGHVEAGLRTLHPKAHIPKSLTVSYFHSGRLSTFAPTQVSKENFKKKDGPIFSLQGNTVIDALKLQSKKTTTTHIEWAKRKQAHQVGRPTVARILENLWRTCSVRSTGILEEFEDVMVVHPIHKNPKVRELASKILGE